ncbi:ribosome silencing factor [Desulfocurvus sp.]|jgi:ribosome-associated protein|uniref:ribosome silencing factor n=1 Tax=Desulfocurvus sp. TaxID=2871698 RepID=UPI0025C244BB|nr:ribosome silencing factor [Desulfocurvus sp.]MCK9240647.1 ribosome silencing factor [Desulfocurvus sp.]
MTDKQSKPRPVRPTRPETEARMREVATWLHDKQARNIVALDVAGLCDIAEGVVLATAGSVRHAQALADHVLDMCGREKGVYLGMEGYQAGSWILLDLNDVLVHVFQDGSRSFYNLEGLWAEAREVELALPGAADDLDGLADLDA